MRLGQIDFDGNSTYSETIEVDFWNTENTIQIFPNPTKDPITVQFPSVIYDKIQFFDAAGRTISLSALNANYNQKQIILALSEFPNGIYFLKTDKDKLRIVKE